MLPPHTDACAIPQQQHLGDFAQVLAHRIRNLLAGIEGCTDLLADTLATQEQRDLALRILESTARIEFVLSDLQRFSQPIEILRLPVRLRGVLERLLVTLDDNVLHRLTLDLPPEDPELLLDPTLLHQALLLLVQNALEASPGDQPVTLSTHVDHSTNQAYFNIHNAGMIGLEEAAGKVFEPFFTTKPDNLGIGLFMARRIAEAHGGHLYLTANDAQEGTRFSLIVPLEKETVSESLLDTQTENAR